MSSVRTIFTFLLSLGVFWVAHAQGPQPGDIYREYAVYLKTGDNWRVTDPGASHPGASEFLPNPVLNISIDDLDQAVRAEVLMDIWGGHAGTSGRRFRFNGKEWIDIPPPPAIIDRNKCYLFQYNAIIDLPLEHIHEGDNTFEGTSSGQVCGDFGWGQWGWYLMMVRVYYHPGKGHSGGRITIPADGDTLMDNPTIRLELDDSLSVSQVQFLGKYMGYDEDGDGYLYDWHRAYHGPEISGHLGTANASPWQQLWNTRYLPDQEEGAVSLMARIQDTTGPWFVCETVDSPTLQRPDSLRVAMFNSIFMPAPFVVRAGNTRACRIVIDSLKYAMEARLYHRTWNAGDDEAAGGTVKKPLQVNGSPYYCKGRNHFFALASRELTVADLKEGYNVIGYSSDTPHHGIEVLWPGPSIIIRYVSSGNKVASPVFTPGDSTFFQGSITPGISTSTEGAVIRITTNGRDPNNDDRRFISGILKINSDAEIKARAYKGDHYQSEVSTVHYLIDHTGLAGPSSDAIAFFPNPAGNQVTMISREQNRHWRYRITDNSGRLVREGEVAGNGTILTGQLPDGNYILSLICEERTFSGKLIIRKK